MKTRIAKLSVVPLGIALALLMSALVSCGKKGASGKPADVDYYTCTMHPSVKSQDPKAKCPICSMNLVPVKKQPGAPMHVHGAHTNAAAPNETVPAAMPAMAGAAKIPAEAEPKPTEFTVPLDRQQL